MEILSNFLYQILFTVGVIFVFGLLIALGRRWFCSMLGYGGYKFILATGFIGTPIHELSHALMCLVFGHKITEIKLFQLHSDDGTLGYVNHSYNPKNIYHQIGNFFIGIAPIVVGSAFLFLFMRLLTPSTFNSVISEINAFNALSHGTFDLTHILELFVNILGSIFRLENFGNFLWWIFVVLAIMISSHMELSGADIKGSVVVVLVFAGLFLVVDVILGLISTPALLGFTATISSVGLTVASFLVISLVFTAIMLAGALIIKIIGRILGR